MRAPRITKHGRWWVFSWGKPTIVLGRATWGDFLETFHLNEDAKAWSLHKIDDPEAESAGNDPRHLLKRVLAYAPSPPSRGLLADIEACLGVPDSDLRAVQLSVGDWQRLLGVARFTFTPQDEHILNAIQTAIAETESQKQSTGLRDV